VPPLNSPSIGRHGGNGDEERYVLGSPGGSPACTSSPLQDFHSLSSDPVVGIQLRTHVRACLLGLRDRFWKPSVF
jgi:hypothetical protein